MGAYREYLEKRMTPAQLTEERVTQLKRIREVRGRPVAVLAASLLAPPAQVGLGQDDLMALEDLLEEVEGEELDLILQVGGGALDLAEELLHVVRARCPRFAVLVPRHVRNPGSLLAFAADEVVLRPLATLQLPVPQVLSGGRVMPADLLADEVHTDPVEREMASAVLSLVRGWITGWAHEHREVPLDQAVALAEALTDSRRWGLSTRGLRAPQLRDMGVPVTVTADQEELDDALARLDALLHLTLGMGAGKLVETEEARIVRAPQPQRVRATPVVTPAPVQAGGTGGGGKVAFFDVTCECGTTSKLQANLGGPSPLQDGYWAFPADDVFHCPECMRKKDLAPVRRQVEDQTRQKIFT